MKKIIFLFMLLQGYAQVINAQPKHELGVNFSANLSGVAKEKPYSTDCYECHETENISLTKKLPGTGTGLGLYDKIILGRIAVINLSLGVNYIHSEFTYKGTYYHYWDNPVTGNIYIQKGYKNDECKLKILYLQPQAEVNLFLKKQDSCRSGFYFLFGISPSFHLKDYSEYMEESADTLVEVNNNVKSTVVTKSAATYPLSADYDANLLKRMNWFCNVGMGYQFDACGRSPLYLELSFYRGISPYHIFHSKSTVYPLAIYRIELTAGIMLR